MAGDSKKTVCIALAANVVVGAVKFVGAALTGSAALFAEGAQSVSDTLNEVFLLTSLVRSDRPPDRRHQFGYGMERFFWSLLAAVGILVGGAGFSGIEAYRAFTSHSAPGPRYYLIAYASLGLVLLAEGTSWVRAVRQVRREAHRAGRGLVEHIRLSSDPSVKTVAGEDSVAMIGVVVAGAGIGLHQLTGVGWWEGVASAVIAGLLVVTAVLLGRDVKGLLIGEAVHPQLNRQLHEFLSAHPAVDRVVDLRTMQIGADKVLLAARVDLGSALNSDEVELASADIDRGINQRWPEVTDVFLDATRTDEPVRDPTVA
ncbi:MAG TPA: cation diffusion facilitator family transporter [Acidimicrobiales bacterium]|nr:cation diffusion facilitator family transporter [Acidimicrobiales bacterium]